MQPPTEALRPDSGGLVAGNVRNARHGQVGPGSGLVGNGVALGRWGGLVMLGGARFNAPTIWPDTAILAGFGSPTSGTVFRMVVNTPTAAPDPSHPTRGPSHLMNVLDPIVEARALVKTYVTGDGSRDVPALRGVDFRVQRGEMVAIMGPSGCGKTTLLNCLAGIDGFDGGDVLIDGRSIAHMSDTELTRYRAQSMGFVFQSFNLLPVLSAVENVEFPLLLSGVAPAEARARARASLRSVGLSDREDHRPARLSGGQQQRVAVARAVVANPAIVWADEPTGNLDSTSADALMALLRDLNRTGGQTFLVVTHAREVGLLCDRIVHMRDGLVTGEERWDGALAPSTRETEG